MTGQVPLEALQRLATAAVFEAPALESADTAWSSHIPFAFWLVDALRPRTFVELGVHTGVSYCAFCQAIGSAGLVATAYGVDTWEGDAQAGRYDGPAVLAALRAHHDPRYLGFSHLLQMTFDAARERFPEGSVDLLHIDGCHSYPAVRHDFETWLPTLSDRGVLLLHDVCVRSGDFGVWRLWEEIKGRYPTFLFPYGYGLGVVGVGADLPEPVAWLLDPRRRPGVRDSDIVAFFAPLGQAYEARSGWARAERALQQSQRERMAAQQEIESLRAAHAQEARQLRQALEQAQQALQRTSAHLDAVLASTSWRLTAPLRAMIDLGLRQARRLRRRLRAATRPGGVPVLAAIRDTRSGALGALATHYPLRERWYDAAAPEVSLIVLNYNRPDLTTECLDSIWRHTEGLRYEVVLVDNGSAPERLLDLAPLANGARLLRLGVNRFFGEGNNLGFEASRGRYVVFLNNDVTVNPGWLMPLIECLRQDPSVGACGPMMLYPGGRLLEAGARIRPDGSSEQFGKGADPDDPTWRQPREVGYVSAAALALRREVFEAVLGFDLCYEPAYYEDSDLCLKIRQLGLRVLYCPDSRIVHQESATTRDLAGQRYIESVIELNRQRFLSRWGAVLRGEVSAVAELAYTPEPLAPPPSTAPSLLLVTPYPLVPGGGERYLLTLAAGLSQRMRVTLATPQPYSRLRLLTLGRELSLNLTAVELTTLDASRRRPAYDWAVVMGNEPLPVFSAPARNSLYLCQFPFPASPETLAGAWSNLEGYAGVVVYSRFVERHYRRILAELGQTPPPIHVVYPPAGDPALAPDSAPSLRKGRAIIGVGRFFRGGHAKRHDLMIQALAKLIERQPDTELHLVGTLAAEPEHMDYYQSLRRQAEGLPVRFHPNASSQTIQSLYAQASVYWHLTGLDFVDETHAYRCEHFGITVVEAMLHGCIPIVAACGGPVEIVTHGVDGYHIRDLDQLVEHTAAILARPADDAAIDEMRRRAMATARRFSESAMLSAFAGLFGLADAAQPQSQPSASP